MNAVAVICTAVLGLLVFGLGLSVSIARFNHKLLIGHPDDPAHIMRKVVRAHGNTAEFAPFLAILILYLGSQQPAPWVVWVMIAGTLARVLIVLGMLTCKSLDRPHPLRFLGALGTYLAGIALAVETLRSALAG